MKEVTTATQCLTDTFSVTNPSGITHPSICGINTGEHSNTFEKGSAQDVDVQRSFFISVYVDASEMCNELAFQLGNSGMGTAITARDWSIKVCHSPITFDLYLLFFLILDHSIQL